MGDKEVVPAVLGTVKNVYDRKCGTGQKGEWSVQSFMLGMQGGDIRVSAWNRPDLSYLTGQRVEICCHASNRGNTGVYVEVSDYKGQTRKGLRITGSAEIVTLQEGQVDSRQGYIPPQPQQQAPQQAYQQPRQQGYQQPQQSAPAQSSDLMKVKKVLNQLSNLDILCHAAADHTRKTLEAKGFQINDETFQGIWRSYYIEANRKNLLDAVPAGAMQAHAQPPPPAPPVQQPQYNNPPAYNGNPSGYGQPMPVPHSDFQQAAEDDDDIPF